jgi:hypothetical protein
MRTIVKFKIVSSFVSGAILVLFGAYYFTMGNKGMAKALFIWGLISTFAGLLWIYASIRHNRKTRS